MARTGAVARCGKASRKCPTTNHAALGSRARTSVHRSSIQGCTYFRNPYKPNQPGVKRRNTRVVSPRIGADLKVLPACGYEASSARASATRAANSVSVKPRCTSITCPPSSAASLRTASEKISSLRSKFANARLGSEVFSGMTQVEPRLSNAARRNSGDGTNQTACEGRTTSGKTRRGRAANPSTNTGCEDGSDRRSSTIKSKHSP
jgi:hypothetical protein